MGVFHVFQILQIIPNHTKHFLFTSLTWIAASAKRPLKIMIYSAKTFLLAKCETYSHVVPEQAQLFLTKHTIRNTIIRKPSSQMSSNKMLHKQNIKQCFRSKLLEQFLNCLPISCHWSLSIPPKISENLWFAAVVKRLDA